MEALLQTALSLMLLGLVVTVTLFATARLLRLNPSWLPGWMRFAWLSDWVLSRDSRQKALGRRFLVAVANCLAGVLALNVGAAHGVIDLEASRWFTGAALLVTLGFYLVMRSGLNRRFADPTLLEPQTWAGIGFLAWGYLIGGPGRPVALLLLVAILAFSMGSTPLRQLVRACLLSGLLFGAAMWQVARSEGVTSAEVTLQVVYFCVLQLVLVTLCLLVGQMNRLQQEAHSHQAELSEALHRIRELATHDDLTGLINRRHMLERLNNEKHRSIRTGRRFCLAMVDIDHFKRVNDQFGHGTGDQVLAQVAGTIAAGLRETDVVARWGGEEFLVMFTDTDQDTATRVLSRIQQALSRTTVADSAPQLRVTFSAGVTSYVPDEMLTRTIDRADRALYAAKASGRNRVVCEPAGSGTQAQAA
ncbi:MAG: GGDEF domain-containing protein [Proteobacteria bacterium]|uniref:diguanylate cyclase n=1 Tax=Aquabacterium sp. TaxID=1872578 RepID=UPI0035C6A8F1|nr:GGDEF domain-containing protein [Pseudomonadota bacterium]